MDGLQFDQFDHHHTGHGPARVPARRLSRRRLFQGTGLLAGAIALGSAFASAPAFASAVGQPSVIPTGGWGASAPRRPMTTHGHRPGYLVIHHTTHQNTPDTSTAAAHQVARLIQRNHLANGWADTGQQFTIARGGQILEGRHGSWDAVRSGTRFVEGAHAYGFNDQSVGIEVDGLYTHAVPPAAQWAALVHLSAYACQQYGIPTDRIIAHRDVPGSSTLCCGDAFYAQLPTLRAEVSAALSTGVAGSGGGSSRGYPTVRRGDQGDAVRRVQQTLQSIGHDPGAVDGVFGAATERALCAYQSSIGTGVDGVAGPRTWGALATHPAAGATVAPGSGGSEVRYLQCGLNATGGLDLATDGAFGDATAAAVRSYQGSRGLAVDGIAGPATWHALQHGR
jgi:peptidoglycan hydrolase-like protein with peptidoglycan-binding domain